jgi:amidohydrolase
MLSDELLTRLELFRRELHQYPEVSGEESETARRVREFILHYALPDSIVYGLGGEGLAFIYNGDDEAAGPTVLVRAELDGLSIEEGNIALPHRSQHCGKSHLCGHDGHMAIVTALAVRIAQDRPKKGRVILLFQPAEETGCGMKAVIADPKFAAIKPDYAFALHNIPGLPLGHVSTKEGSFSSSVESLIFNFEGMTSHAAEPERAINPSSVIADIILFLERQNAGDDASPDFVRASVTHVMLGSPDSHGVTAGTGQLNVTIRARTPQRMATVNERLRQFIDERVAAYNAAQSNPVAVLTYTSEVTEPFDANVNDAEAVDIIRKAAKTLGVTFVEQQVPNNWGEDNGALTNLEGVKGAMFGLGSGEQQLPLHNMDFDFPDSLIETGSAIFMQAIRQLCYEG